MTQFLGLMHTIALEPSVIKTYPRQTIMTQYMLKLLTILSNILVTNLQAIDANATENFVLGLLQTMKETKLSEISLSNADSLIPICPAKASKETIALTLGFSLLKELTFKFLTYVSEEVTPTVLRPVLLEEFTIILQSLVKAHAISK